MKTGSDLSRITDSLTEQQWNNLYIAHARGERTDVIPFPSEDIQTITNNQKGEVTARGAISILGCILSCAREVVNLSRNMKILDYGCGWGRITRLLPFYFDVNCITGVDVDDRLINSANELVPFIKHTHIKSMNPLPFQSDYFDIVFANSVFSHLSEKACQLTLSELSRTLKNGGVLIISILQKNELNRFYFNEDQKKWITKILGKQDKALATLKQKGFLWGGTGRWPEYGIAVIDESWIAKTFHDIGIQFLGSKSGQRNVTQNYMYGAKGYRAV